MVDVSKDQVTISIVGTGTGDGGGVAPTPNQTLALVPGTQPNLLVNVITPAAAIFVRFVNVFLTTFVGLLTAAGVGDKIFVSTDFRGLVLTCLWASLISAGVATLKNLITVFGRLEGKYPLATGSI
jgi:hypothetical protein